MRVIAGEAKGRRLVAPKGLGTRPTADRVREALFGIVAPRIAGARVLDLFAGSGAVGIEALSRGAARAVFVERDRAALAALRQNLARLGFEPRARVIARDAQAALRDLARAGARFELVFLDPPYAGDLALRTLAALGKGEHLAASALVIVQHRAKAELPEAQGSLRRVRVRRFGETALTFFAPVEYTPPDSRP